MSMYSLNSASPKFIKLDLNLRENRARYSWEHYSSYSQPYPICNNCWIMLENGWPFSLTLTMFCHESVSRDSHHFGRWNLMWVKRMIEWNRERNVVDFTLGTWHVRCLPLISAKRMMSYFQGFNNTFEFLF